MDRRYIVFMVLSLGLMVGYVALDLFLYPPQLRERNVAADADGEVPNPDDPVANDGDPDKKGSAEDGPQDAPTTNEGDPKAGNDPKPVDPGAAPDADPDGDPSIAASPSPQHPAKWSVLGSYDGSVAGPHAITFSTKGGGIVRWELVERNDKKRLIYRELDKKSGYLGVSAWEQSKGGCVVRAIVPGSPAAGSLQVGDELQMIDDEPLRTKESLVNRLREHKAGESVELTVSRGGNVSKVPVKLSPRPLELIRPERNEAGAYTGAPPSFLVDVHSINGDVIDPANPLLRAFQQLRDDHWKIEKIGRAHV